MLPTGGALTCMATSGPILNDTADTEDEMLVSTVGLGAETG